MVVTAGRWSRPDRHARSPITNPIPGMEAIPAMRRTGGRAAAKVVTPIVFGDALACPCPPRGLACALRLAQRPEGAAAAQRRVNVVAAVAEDVRDVGVCMHLVGTSSSRRSRRAVGTGWLPVPHKLVQLGDLTRTAIEVDNPALLVEHMDVPISPMCDLLPHRPHVRLVDLLGVR